ncbi:hypothetical protein [Siphonobacter sp. SORGH_AS_0500]|uniref:hypothetical protein n=1 Tax=Siphonobacter sp. SORGH_AS_0500 TaxID=1864824 RepID=UPI00286061A8|nr:hypothetical protein [Siphonobacter sp. SORGH_AS_0500]MDR6193227.1 hypothetical protein [Siphonobacter sp. SORGH_AS_0500]
MKNRLSIAVLVTGAFLACSKPADPTPGTDSKYQEEGYIMASISQTSASETYYAGYFPTLPSGSVDLTTKASYSNFVPRTAWKNYLFGPPLVSDKKLAKMAVVKATGAIEEVASIPLVDYLQAVIIINDQLGVYSTGGNRTLFMFNPSTMESLGQIDMSSAQNFPNNDLNNYAYLTYRASDNRLFAALYTNSYKTGQYYDAQNVYVEVINLTTRKWEKTTVYEQATYPFTRGANNGIVDEAGNVYIITQGQYGLDGQLGPNAAKRSKPQILKIPAGSTDFDKSYSFTPVTATGLPNLMFQLLLGGVYDANGIMYACLSGQPDSARLLELIAKLATNSITSSEYQELSNLAFYDPNQRWAKLDLNAQTATFISDMPLTAGYAYPITYKYDGKIYMPVYNTSLKQNGMYSYDPATGKSTSLNTLAAGGMITHFFKLTK